MIYLLHFDQPISPKSTTQHYLGFAGQLDQRLAAHAAGTGARLTQVAIERGITWQVARTWPGDRATERWLKARRNPAELCPLCAGSAAWRRGVLAAEPLAIITTRTGRPRIAATLVALLSDGQRYHTIESIMARLNAAGATWRPDQILRALDSKLLRRHYRVTGTGWRRWRFKRIGGQE